MALWTPAALAVAPRAWWNGDAAVFSGSNLSSWANSGSEAGAAALSGTPTKATLNALNGVRIDASGEKWSQTLAAWSTGKLFAFVVLKKLASPSPNESGFVSKGSVSPTSGLSLAHSIINGSTDQIGFLANGYTQAPSIGTDLGSDPLGTGARLLGGQLGTINGLWLDGAPLTPFSNTIGAIPTLASGSWDFGMAWGAGEHANADIFQLILLDHFPTTTERQQLEGWAAWKYGLQAGLAVGHPYEAEAPQVIVTPPTPRTPTDRTLAVQGERRVLSVPGENRTLAVQGENRTLRVS